MRRVVAGRRVGGHAHQLLQEVHFLVEVGVDPGVEFGRSRSWSVGFVRRRGCRAGAGRPRTASCMSSLVIDSSGLWLMPEFIAAHEQHRLRHHLVQLHRVVAGAAGHAEQRQAERVDRALPALLPVGRARRGGGAHRLLERVAHAAPLADRAAARPARRARSASRCALVVRADVEAELAAPGHHVDRAARHLEHADGADRVGVLARRAARRRATSSATAAAASRRRSIGVVPAWLAMPITSPT